MHGTELIEILDFLILTNPRQLNERTIYFDLLLRIRLGATMGKDILDMPHRHYFVHLKAAIIETSKDFCLGEHPLASFVDVIIKTTREHQTRQNTFIKEIERVNEPVQPPRIAFEDF